MCNVTAHAQALISLGRLSVSEIFVFWVFSFQNCIIAYSVGKHIDI